MALLNRQRKTMLAYLFQKLFILKDDAELTAREVLEIQLRFDSRFIRGYTPKSTERVFITHRQWRQLPLNLQLYFEHGFITR